MNLDFLTPTAPGRDAVARSPMERQASSAGARFEVRDGFNVAVGYATAESEAATARKRVGWADCSHLAKLELQGPAEELEAIAARCEAELELGRAVRAGETWWCLLTPSRALVVGGSGGVRERIRAAAAEAAATHVADVTSCFAALTVAGPLAGETFARFCALDLRPGRTPAGAVRPGSIGRQPGILICEAPDRYLILFGWATGEYIWSVVEDAARHLGGAPIGVDALEVLAKWPTEVAA